MRLLKVPDGSTDGEWQDLELVNVTSGSTLPYAILSHTWNEGEVLFGDVKTRTAHHKPGYQKVRSAINQASWDCHQYIWVDTCCIDKRSSSELQEAINSMYAWYRDAAVCYVFLDDVQVSMTETQGYQGVARSTIEKSRWFTRGWTLQELLAPQCNIRFFSNDWVVFGTLHDMSYWKGAREPWDRPICQCSVCHGTWPGSSCNEETICFTTLLSQITGIGQSYLENRKSIESASIATRMYWASARITTRPEDVAYCLLGLFDVNIPLLYGEVNKAFVRLQEEILRVSDDHSLFAWSHGNKPDEEFGGILACHPACFKNSGNIYPMLVHQDVPPYGMTNRGVQITLPLLHLTNNLYVAILACMAWVDPTVTNAYYQDVDQNGHVARYQDVERDSHVAYYGLYVRRSSARTKQFARAFCGQYYMASQLVQASSTTETIYLDQKLNFRYDGLVLDSRVQLHLPLNCPLDFREVWCKEPIRPGKRKLRIAQTQALHPIVTATLPLRHRHEECVGVVFSHRDGLDHALVIFGGLSNGEIAMYAVQLRNHAPTQDGSHVFDQVLDEPGEEIVWSKSVRSRRLHTWKVQATIESVRLSISHDLNAAHHFIVEKEYDVKLRLFAKVARM